MTCLGQPYCMPGVWQTGRSSEAFRAVWRVVKAINQNTRKNKCQDPWLEGAKFGRREHHAAPSPVFLVVILVRIVITTHIQNNIQNPEDKGQAEQDDAQREG